MQHDWIIDVLTDLTTYARSNQLEALAEQLADAELVAQIEIASSAKGSSIGLFRGHARDRRASGAA
ncbi:hypothetical protein [Salipiger sp.]|uniref:hypothetical protein n=1 Tax=Salipiger sp. TaxID=2078585 RepID=UPI003A9787AD